MRAVRSGASVVDRAREPLTVLFSVSEGLGSGGVWLEADIVRQSVGPQGVQNDIVLTCYADRTRFEFATVAACDLSPHDTMEALQAVRDLAERELPRRDWA